MKEVQTDLFQSGLENKYFTVTISRFISIQIATQFGLLPTTNLYVFKMIEILGMIIFELNSDLLLVYAHTFSFLKRVKAAFLLSSADCPCVDSVLETTLINTDTMSSTFVNNSLQET